MMCWVLNKEKSHLIVDDAFISALLLIIQLKRVPEEIVGRLGNLREFGVKRFFHSSFSNIVVLYVESSLKLKLRNFTFLLAKHFS